MYLFKLVKNDIYGLSCLMIAKYWWRWDLNKHGSWKVIWTEARKRKGTECGLCATCFHQSMSQFSPVTVSLFCPTKSKPKWLFNRSKIYHIWDLSCKTMCGAMRDAVNCHVYLLWIMEAHEYRYIVTKGFSAYMHFHISSNFNWQS